MLSELERSGRVWFRRALDPAQLLQFEAVTRLGEHPGARLPLDAVDLSAVTALAQRLMPSAKPVRVVAFNKSEEHNWTLPWHQDRVVALKERAAIDGFANWTCKAGTWHAEPSIQLLQTMMFARVHIDPATVENACLRLALGTHALGKVASAEADAIAAGAPNEACEADRGDVLFAKALLLHRSGPSQTSASRRAIRIDYCNQALPAPLAWAA
jgi:ectoine hydroxylase-related dioxygenase (phytanoyl-CoA dioxygenase family)